jgi:hypothetical protein
MAQATGWLRKLAIAVHAAIVGVMVVMGLGQPLRIVAQLRSGYVPPDNEIDIVIAVLPFILAGVLLLGMRPWLSGRRTLLIGGDVLVVACSFSIFILYVFQSDIPLLLMALAPIGLVLAIVEPRRRGGSTATRNKGEIST